jgi:hypothetical protein
VEYEEKNRKQESRNSNYSLFLLEVLLDKKEKTQGKDKMG